VPTHVEDTLLATSAKTNAAPLLADTNVLQNNHNSQEACIVETARQSSEAAQAAVAEQATAAAIPTKTGPITAIRNFFKGLFSSSAPRQAQKTNATAATSTGSESTEPAAAAAAATTTTTVASTS
jgi:hypothetical protein